VETWQCGCSKAEREASHPMQQEVHAQQQQLILLHLEA
jgi:hypothetical protein